jgi:glycosyltransferase involved in cell wall biosynthesis
MMESVRVAYTLEQCWHRIPGGTAVAALRTADAIVDRGDVELIGVAGRHRRPPDAEWRPRIPWRQLPLHGPWLYQSWLYLGRPRPESVTGHVDVVHATSIIPCPTRRPLVVTVHDVAFLHRPEQFTRHGNRVFRRSLAKVRRDADLILCSSQATMDDCEMLGFASSRLRHVPLGVEATAVGGDAVARVRAAYALPEQFLLFVGTVEPRKNLRRLADAVAALDEPLPLVVAGARGWGDAAAAIDGDVRFLGFVPIDDLHALYAAAEVFCYPSLHEGYGLPVLEAMVQGAPVVTSAGTATAEAAGGAAVLVDPHDTADIARGIEEARARRGELRDAGIARAARATWTATAEETVRAYRELA